MMIKIDGSLGEGGGQVLRSSLTLSAMTGQDLQITNIRAKRSKPGLRAQHLQAVRATAQVCNAQVEGAQMGSQRLLFRPGEIRAGNFHFEIGTAGATTLVFQTIFLPLSKAAGDSSVTITGGTHVSWSPCFHYLDQHWLLFMHQMGFDAELSLKLAGFYPQGGGRISATVRPAVKIAPLQMTNRGELKQVRGLSGVANLKRSIAERQRSQVLRRLGDRYYLNDIRIVNLPARFKGTFLILIAEFEKGRSCYFSLGEIGKPAERVADDAIDEMEAFMDTQATVDQYLADQLLLPMVFASGPSIIKTSKVSQHLLTNAEVIRAFLPVEIVIGGQLGHPGVVQVQP
jgi:RNA 3'-terminal phosphate cyclase (ATP)